MCMIGSCKKEKIVAHCESVYVGTLGLKEIKREKLPTIKKKKSIYVYIYIYIYIFVEDVHAAASRSHAASLRI